MNTIQQTPSTIDQQTKINYSSVKENEPILSKSQNQVNSNGDQKPQQLNIFGKKSQGPKTTSIFSKNQTNGQKINIFANSSKTVNLFNVSNKPQVTKIFNSNIKPAVASTQQDEVSGSSHSTSNSKSQRDFKIDPQIKIMKFNYKPSLQKITSYPLKKIRIDFAPCRQNTTLTLQKSPDNSDTVCFVVRTNQTKLVFYQGNIIKNLSKASSFMGKMQNVRINIFRQKKESEITPQSSFILKKEEVKMQFQTAENGKDFLELMQKLFENTNNSVQSHKAQQKNEKIEEK